MSEKNIFITGVSRGLGHALATIFLEKGYQVYGTSRHEPSDLAKNSNFKFLSIDLTDYKEIEKKVPELLSGIKKINYAFLNAGTLGELAPLKESSCDEISQVFNLNVLSNKVIIDELMKISPPEKIIGISSGAAFNGSAGWGKYSISKSALNLLLRTYAKEHIQTQFIALAPGLVHTDMLQKVFNEPEDSYSDGVKRIKEAKTQGKVMEPKEAAKLIYNKMEIILKNESGSFVDIRNI